MAEYLAPGIYIEEQPALPASIHPASTSMVAFIGYTEKGVQSLAETAQPATALTADKQLYPVRISSLIEFEQLFGGPALASDCQLILDSAGLASVSRFKPAPFYLYAALQLYFANGGGPCVIVSVGDYTQGKVTLQPLLDGLNACATQVVHLLVCPEACRLPIEEYRQWSSAALTQCAQLRDRFSILDMHGGNDAMDSDRCNISTAANTFRQYGCPDTNLQYAAVYTPPLLTTFAHRVDAATTNVMSAAGKRAHVSPSLESVRTKFPRQYQACMQAIRQIPYHLPPSSAVAAAYVRTDQTRGVWKAPANISLNAVVRPCLPIDKIMQGDLNVDTDSGKSINAIRSFANKGTLIWGARTLAGNDNEWRYIPVRRLAIHIEMSILHALQSMTFEVNDANTWGTIAAMINSFMTNLWRDGALQGSKPEQAFYVRVGLGSTMSAADIQAGLLKVELGFAPFRPAEFILLRFSLAAASPLTVSGG